MKRIFRFNYMLPVVLLTASQASAAEPGYVEDFLPGDGIAGFFSSVPLSNPGTGGVGEAGDGFLLLELEDPSHFGTATSRSEFTGNLIADGVTGFSFWLNDVGEDQNFEIHVGVGTAHVNFWLNTVGLTPPENEWGYFEVDFSNPGEWTQIMGSGTFEDALASSNRLLFRHDTPPFEQHPSHIVGDLGIDRITVVPEPTTILVLAALLGAAGMRRLRRR